MKHLHISSLISFILMIHLPNADARIEVVSSTCMTKVGHLVLWLKCPDDSDRFPESLQEIKNDLVTYNHDQKFCCGDLLNRYCCDYEQKIKEDSRFDLHNYITEKNEEIKVELRSNHHRSFLQVLIWSALVSVIIIFLLYIFWSFIVVIVDCLCSCLCKMRKSQKSDIQQSLVIPQPMHENTMETRPIQTRNDLYQQVTPPSYDSLA